MHFNTALIADSTCDIPDALLEKYQITLIPQYIIWGEEELRDRIDIQSEAFYRRLVEDARYPSTAHPTPLEFRDAYLAARAQGAQEVVVATVSSAMSGTYQAARQGAEMVDFPVYVHDAKGPTMSLGWQALAMANVREAGGDAKTMIARAEQVRSRLVQWVALDTLEFLYKGGRIGNATRLIGTLLDLKPLIHINHQTGLVEEAGRARTHRKAQQALFDGFFKQLNPDGKTLRIAVLHGNAPKDAEQMAARIRQAYQPAELIIAQTSPNLGVHTGPGAVALCGYTEDSA